MAIEVKTKKKVIVAKEAEPINSSTTKVPTFDKPSEDLILQSPLIEDKPNNTILKEVRSSKIYKFKGYITLLGFELGLKLWNLILVLILALVIVLYTVVFVIIIIPDYLLTVLRFIVTKLETQLIDVIRLKLGI